MVCLLGLSGSSLGQSLAVQPVPASLGLLSTVQSSLLAPSVSPARPIALLDPLTISLPTVSVRLLGSLELTAVSVCGSVVVS